MSLKPKDFWSFVNKTDTCWLWTGPVNPTHAYGNYHRAGVTVRAHRWAYVETFGVIPFGSVICHHCDNKLCVRPDHLFVGSHADNVRDKIEKGRQAKGERNGWSKLTQVQVDEIRKRHVRYKHSGPSSAASLAREFGIDTSTVRQIVRREHWR